MIRVLMQPDVSKFDTTESGIKRVVQAYDKYGADYGIEIVSCNIEDASLYDLFAIHAGTTNKYPTNKPIVAHLHGLYWTADYTADLYEWKANSNVVESVRRATVVTVPSDWVAETVARDARIIPFVVPHGIVCSEWEHDYENEGYVLWNKNRIGDVCDPNAVSLLAQRFTAMRFFTTFLHPGARSQNITEIGLVPHNEMKMYIQKAGVYLSTTKETFGIGILEALASGVPVLGFNYGGNKMLIRHGIDGYLATPNNYEDLERGLAYCIQHREILGENAKALAREWTWENAMKSLKRAYDEAMRLWEYDKVDLVWDGGQDG